MNQDYWRPQLLVEAARALENVGKHVVLGGANAILTRMRSRREMGMVCSAENIMTLAAALVFVIPVALALGMKLAAAILEL